MDLKNITQKINKEIKKAKKRFSDDFDLESFQNTNPRVIKYTEKQKAIKMQLASAP